MSRMLLEAELSSVGNTAFFTRENTKSVQKSKIPGSGRHLGG